MTKLSRPLVDFSDGEFCRRNAIRSARLREYNRHDPKSRQAAFRFLPILPTTRILAFLTKRAGFHGTVWNSHRRHDLGMGRPMPLLGMAIVQAADPANSQYNSQNRQGEASADVFAVPASAGCRSDFPPKGGTTNGSANGLTSSTNRASQPIIKLPPITQVSAAEPVVLPPDPARIAGRRRQSARPFRWQAVPMPPTPSLRFPCKRRIEWTLNPAIPT